MKHTAAFAERETTRGVGSSGMPDVVMVLAHGVYLSSGGRRDSE